ncbi:tail fiber protein [Algoriphagus sp. C2-6-M1]|uniref:phage tail protein n=1 Tax=Algoriphagus persicinus TaxID=3108754 RepID=UPI002B3C95FA|nr:tail fiber protein [Algoriphagus sp. C2-6-M1]MEB2779834.1 tail fiber protein [Algoriphagus sp. C2-6-M1]
MEELIGVIKLFAGNFAPRNYALCQGQLLAISTNQALFSILGTTYGGDGRTTFALPDLRARAAIGEGQGPGLSRVLLGEKSGAQHLTLTVNNMPNHTHPLNVSTSTGITNNPAGQFIAAHNVTVERNGLPIAGSSFNAASNATMAPNAIGNTGGNTPINTMNPYLGLHYIICIYGVYPSRN